MKGAEPWLQIYIKLLLHSISHPVSLNNKLQKEKSQKSSKYHKNKICILPPANKLVDLFTSYPTHAVLKYANAHHILFFYFLPSLYLDLPLGLPFYRKQTMKHTKSLILFSKVLQRNKEQL